MTLVPPSPRVKPQQPSAALLVTASNCEAVLGLRWRLVRKHAAAMNVPVYAIGKKLAINAELLLAALGRSTQATPPVEQLDDAAQRDAMREALGLRGAG